MADGNSPELVARLVRQCLEEGASVEIDGLGVFRRKPRGGFEFFAEGRPKLFLAHVQEDTPAAERLYDAMLACRLDPWLDRRKLLPGQNWPRAIERAIEVSDFFVACFSKHSIGKRGQFQAELRYALDCAARLPLDQTYFIPVRLEECGIPLRIRQEIQYVDLFPDWDRGFGKIVAAIRRQMRMRAATTCCPASS